MPEEIPKETILEIKNEMNNTIRRVSALEQNSMRIQNEMNNRSFNWNKTIHGFTNELDIIKNNLESLRKEFQNNLSIINNIITEFRGCVKRDSLEKFERKINDMKFEKMVTKEEFKKLMQDNP